jgi:c-di-GMP-related signal transduction protein
MTPISAAGVHPPARRNSILNCPAAGPIKQSVNVCVARQPIFDRQRDLYGYELLYRSNTAQNEFDGTEASAATRQVISSTLLSIGLENILCGKKAFVNFDQSLLSDGIHRSLPCQTTVIEILESVEPNAGLLALCQSIRAQGYTIALDDFVSSPEFEPLTHLAHLIKVDVLATTRREQERLLRTYQPRGIALLAEKVETYEEFEWARAAGYDYFQGYFFARPSVIQSRRLPASTLNCLRLLSELQTPDLDFKRLEALIRGDVGLSYKLLRYVNSALFTRHDPVPSIERALLIVGSDEIRRWAMLATLPTLASDKPGELAALAIVRARFCERLIQLAGISLGNEAFLMGMFSLLDALLDRPLDETLFSIGLAPDIVHALLGTAGEQSALSRVYQLTCHYEQGDWDQVERLALGCGISALAAGGAYAEATVWAEQIRQQTAN